MIDDSQCWTAVLERDGSFDGAFYFGVVTTGVFCKPSCPSRHPLRRNVRFFESPADAAKAGLRPCLRCRPASAPDTAMSDLCRYIEEHCDQRLDLAKLATRVGLSRFHLQRSFKAAVGLTPKQYLEAHRVGKLKRELRSGDDVVSAVYQAGFGSSSRVYERADTRLGMTPRQYRQGGEGMSITHATIETHLGSLMLAATSRGLCFVQFGESAGHLLEALRREFPAATLEPMLKPAPVEFGRWMQALQMHLDSAAPLPSLPLDIRGTVFTMRVWEYLRTIPQGGIRSYSQVAEGVGKPTAVRAVARACASNRVALLIPCHRVIRSDGGLGGYRWGIERKQSLLESERRG